MIGKTVAKIIEREGMLAKYSLIIKGPRGGEKSKEIQKKYKVEKMPDGTYVIRYSTVSGSTGVNSRGTVSSRAYVRQGSSTADEVEVYWQPKHGDIQFVKRYE